MTFPKEDCSLRCQFSLEERPFILIKLYLRTQEGLYYLLRKNYCCSVYAFDSSIFIII